MPKSKPSTGPMNIQPVENRATASTQTQPVMPAIGRPKKIIAPKTQPHKTQANPQRNERAQLSRQKSLRKQREALKAGRLSE
jgi:hypothetical protein